LVCKIQSVSYLQVDRCLEHMDYVIRVYPRSIRPPVNANPAESGEMHDLDLGMFKSQMFKIRAKTCVILE
jgi:hypothetical protein